MADILTLFKTMLIVQLFFAFSISVIVYTIPADAVNYVTSFSDVTDSINLEGVSQDVQENLERQSNIPIIDIGALVFYSGNIILDLILNFTFAIPEMVGLIIYGVTKIFGIDAYLVGLIELFFSVVVIALYFISVMQLLIGIRSGRVV